MTATSRPWTCAEQGRLRRMVAEGRSVAEISAALHRSARSISVRKTELRIISPLPPMRGVCAGKAARSGRIVDVLRAAIEPMSKKDLAAAVYGEATEANVVSLRVLIYGLRRRGVRIVTEDRRYRLDTSPTPALMWSDRRDAEALGMHSRGVPAGRIATRLGLPTDAVARRLCVLELRRRAA